VIHVQITLCRVLAAVLAAEVIPDHQIATGKPDRDPWRSIVAQQVQDAGRADLPAHDRQAVVVAPHGLSQPGLEIVRFTRVVHRMGGTAEQQYDGAANGGHTNGREVSIQ
jgi:hypothetical protein